ncbi:MAG: DEAD/DEAH box helicase family protein [Candidatus Cloacimonetes bacterium]|nr:DEAD/DEAH box helicase family protein [Candidatus Cloacimonadota bacterium]MDY0172452.1 DEAD/DEAH box helicase family protein [Candidatus Cloacimonadaceae bacterium]
MARQPKEKNHKFTNKLILNQWLMSQFGIDPLLEYEDKSRPFHKLAAPIKDARLEGFDNDGLHKFYHALVESELFYNEFHPISKEQLLIYEENIVSHTRTINTMRSRPIVWKYFQWLTLLFVEIYLDRYFTDKEKLLEDLNAYVDRFNAKWTGFQNVELYFLDDLNKLCLQNATGSGKTLLMHVNLLQFRSYAKKSREGSEISRVILLSPNERLSEQHLEELKLSGFGFAQRLNTKQSGSLDMIDVIEITKLGDTEGPNTIATRSLGDQNLLLVDEGHRGMSGKEEGVWFTRRSELCAKGFTFEYSATFAQAVAAAGNKTFEDSYAKTIIFDYSYRWFYEDGFGKDYQILNLPKTYSQVQDVYLTACLLKYYQQLKVYEDKKLELVPFNLEKPLWVFVGSTVTKAKGGTNDEKIVAADVAQIIVFIAKFLCNSAVFQSSIQRILYDNGNSTGLLDKDGNDIFAHSFNYLLKIINPQDGIEALYRDILAQLFNNPANGQLRMDRIKGDSGEVALYLGNSDTPFGLINVGDAKGLCDHVDEYAKQNDIQLSVGDSDFSEAMFASVKDSSSPINLLIGSKKFVEGWDCWRVSTMGLMHVGKSEGTQIIQLFGRGVRLKGYEWSLKRSGHSYATTKPNFIEDIETLNVFGIESDFMEKFRQYLKDEGLPGNEKRLVITIPMNVTADFGKRLKILRPKKKKDGSEYDFKKDGPVPTLGIVPPYLQKNQVVSDWYPRIQTIKSAGAVQGGNKDEVKLRRKQINLLDMDRLYFELERFKREQRMYNLNLTKQGMLSLLSDSSWYRLYLPQTRLSPQNYDEVLILQQIATELLRRFCEKYYNFCKDSFIKPRMELRDLTREDDNLPSDDVYRLIVDGDDATVIAQIEKLKQEIMNNKDELLSVGDLKACNFGKHLFQPLFHVRNGGNITILPVAFNESEYQFITDLKTWCDKNTKVMKDKGLELYLLRNLSMGKGVGFFEAGNFHPDFILWILSDDKQYVHFIEPHGLMHEGINSEKIQFHKRIKEIETRLGDPNVILSSWILSWTPKSELKVRGYDPDEYLKNNVVFMELPEYINQLFQNKKP